MKLKELYFVLSFGLWFERICSWRCGLWSGLVDLDEEHDAIAILSFNNERFLW